MLIRIIDTLSEGLDFLHYVGKKWKAAWWTKVSAALNLDREMAPPSEYSQTLVIIINLFEDTIVFLDIMIL